MQSMSYTTARSHLAATMKKVCDDHAPVVITRSGATPVVMLSLADFEEIQETYYLIKNPANATRLLQSMDEIEQHIQGHASK